MFIMVKERKAGRLSVVVRVIAASFKCRSFKPITWLFRSGRYGQAHQLDGTFFDYEKYRQRQGRRINFTVG